MGLIFSARDYKLAKIVSKDLAAVLPKVDAAIKQLEPYVRYSQIAHMLNEMRERRIILKAQLDKYTSIVEQKGLSTD